MRGSVHAMELDVSGGRLFLVGQERRIYTLDMAVPKATLKQYMHNHLARHPQPF